MAPMIRLFCGVGVCAALFLSYAHLSLDWSDNLAMVKDHAGERISLQVERAREARLTEQFEELNKRIAAKDRIADRLTAGEMTLIEAAATFGELYDRAQLRTEIRRISALTSEGEVLCRQVIGWVDFKVQTEQSPAEAYKVRNRLEAELRSHLAEHGTVELPQ